MKTTFNDNVKAVKVQTAGTARPAFHPFRHLRIKIFGNSLEDGKKNIFTRNGKVFCGYGYGILSISGKKS
jgi:hypothetical protein